MEQKLARRLDPLIVLGFLPLCLTVARVHRPIRRWLAPSFLGWRTWSVLPVLVLCFFAGYALPRVIVSARKWGWAVLLALGLSACFRGFMPVSRLSPLALLLSSLLGTWTANRFHSRTIRRDQPPPTNGNGHEVTDSLWRFCRSCLAVLGFLGLFLLVAPQLMMAARVAAALLGEVDGGSLGAAVAGVLLQAPYWAFCFCSGYALPKMLPSARRWHWALLLAAGLSACPLLYPPLFVPFAWGFVGGVKRGLMALLPLLVACLIGRWVRDIVDTRKARTSQSS